MFVTVITLLFSSITNVSYSFSLKFKVTLVTSEDSTTTKEFFKCEKLESGSDYLHNQYWNMFENFNKQVKELLKGDKE